MPTYQYQCRDCGYGFDQFQKFSEDPLTECPRCDGTVRRVIQNVGVVFKGSGWYINDSRNSGKSDAANGSTASADAPKADSAETKPAAATETKASGEKAMQTSEKAKPTAPTAAS